MPEYIFTFGKHKGSYMGDVPAEYIEWLIKEKQAELDMFRAELDRRARLQEDQMPMIEKLVSAGYKSLAQRFHPDKGGATADFQALQAAYEQLRAALRALK